jgi:hypothetical protein
MTEEKDYAKPAAMIGLGLLLGLLGAGYLIGRGTARFRAETRTVTVKGLVEREVNADQAVWTLNLRRAGDDVKDLQAQIARDRDAVIAFLTRQGFKENEMTRQPLRTVDRFAREFGQSQERFRYLVTGEVIVKTPNVEQVQKSLGNVEELLRAGVVLDGEREGPANPRYVLTKFNDLRPQLLAEATRNARTIAQQFAADSGASVGKIHTANQGAIQIFGSEGDDESSGFSPTSTPVKRIRVVSTFEFEID